MRRRRQSRPNGARPPPGAPARQVWQVCAGGIVRRAPANLVRRRRRTRLARPTAQPFKPARRQWRRPAQRSGRAGSGRRRACDNLCAGHQSAAHNSEACKLTSTVAIVNSNQLADLARKASPPLRKMAGPRRVSPFTGAGLEARRPLGVFVSPLSGPSASLETGLSPASQPPDSSGPPRRTRPQDTATVFAGRQKVRCPVAPAGLPAGPAPGPIRAVIDDCFRRTDLRPRAGRKSIALPVAP